MAAKKKLFFLAQMGAPGRYDPAVFAKQPGGDNEILWFENMLGDLGLLESIEYGGRRICYGEALPHPSDGDAYVIGGSFHSVHDDLPWQHDIRAWLKGMREAETQLPVFGICGGHQLMSQVLGGSIEMMAEGPAIGTLPINLTKAGRDSFLFDGVIPRFNFGNEEHVSTAPPDATVLASTAQIPNCALDYQRGWVSVQFHPEATDRCMTESWGPKAATIADHYMPTPDAPRLFLNFLKANGIL
ncbi:MAG: type 1 glutamine amidotransferase [Alphaproteobacteria bacterium]|nr:type 1 glutamine amidotransferase [Alphaproteobacteria bacterium]